eukprot:g76863.t1
MLLLTAAMGTKIVIPTPGANREQTTQAANMIKETILFQDHICLVPCWYTLKRQDGLLELDTTEAPPEITAIHPDKRDLIVSPVKWADAAARLLLMDQNYYKKACQSSTEEDNPKPIDFEAIERENKKIRSCILCRSGRIALKEWICCRLNNARVRMEQRYRPGEPDEHIPTNILRPTRPKWRTKRTLDMLRESQTDNHPKPVKEPRIKPTKWTPLQREQFESSIKDSIAAQQCPQAMIVQAIAATRAATTDTHPPIGGGTSYSRTNDIIPPTETTTPAHQKSSHPASIPADTH